jgi:hypothetical protein
MSKSRFVDSEQPVVAPEFLTSYGVTSVEAVGSQLVLALEAAYGAVREQHPDVPPAVIVINSGGNVKYGHFARSRWSVRGDKIAEIMISAEGLQRPPEMVLATLIHEAAHGVAFTRDIPDTTKEGKYHNKKFAKIAEELGLNVSTHAGRPSIGHSNTTLPEGEWSDVLEELKPKLVAYREFDPDREFKPRKHGHEKAECYCSPPRIIRASERVLEQGPIVCGVCGEEFE